MFDMPAGFGRDNHPPRRAAGPGRSVTIAFVGDMMLGRRVDAAAATMPPDSFLGDTLPVLNRANAVFANLESPITESTRAWRDGHKAFRFRAGPRAIDILKAANVRFVNLANNHMGDYGDAGLLDTLRHLDGAGIARAGAGRDSADAMRPALFDIGGVTVGAIAITDNMAEFAARPDRAGTNHVRIGSDHVTLGMIQSQVRKLRAAGATIVVLSAHWGPNLRPWPSRRFKRFARAAIDLGVDVFHGHSAHLLQGFEIRDHGLILYDTGNFLDDYWTFPFIRTDRSSIFVVEFGPNGFERVRIVPVALQQCRVRLAQGRSGRAIVAKLLRASRNYMPRATAIAPKLQFARSEPVTSTTRAEMRALAEVAP